MSNFEIASISGQNIQQRHFYFPLFPNLSFPPHCLCEPRLPLKKWIGGQGLKGAKPACRQAGNPEVFRLFKFHHISPASFYSSIFAPAVYDLVLFPLPSPSRGISYYPSFTVFTFYKTFDRIYGLSNSKQIKLPRKIIGIKKCLYGIIIIATLESWQTQIIFR